MEAGEVDVGGLKRQPAGNRPPLARPPRPPAVCAPRPSCRPQPRPAVWLAGGLADNDDYTSAHSWPAWPSAHSYSRLQTHTRRTGARRDELDRGLPPARSSQAALALAAREKARKTTHAVLDRSPLASTGDWLTTGNNFRDHSQHIRRCLVCLGKRLTHAKKGDGGRQRKRGNCHRQSGTRWTARCTGDGRARLWLGRRQKGWRS